ncbi:MAG: hypothetical protein KDI71_20285, partial [Xanthomonadales bacterium]|nr:hypothetical protein [Xanthomonadales bacterium]
LLAQEFDLAPACLTIIDRLRSIHPERQVEVKIQPSMSIYGDASLLFLCMTNLIENAWKFTRSRESAEISVRVIHQENSDTVEVRDNGVGFDMRYSEVVWQPFKRVSIEQGFPGTGIGLAVVDRIARRHGGQVQVQAKVGQGANFSLILPRPR